jgi:hypothetical protein
VGSHSGIAVKHCVTRGAVLTHILNVPSCSSLPDLMMADNLLIESTPKQRQVGQRSWRASGWADKDQSGACNAMGKVGRLSSGRTRGDVGQRLSSLLVRLSRASGIKTYSRPEDGAESVVGWSDFRPAWHDQDS